MTAAPAPIPVRGPGLRRWAGLTLALLVLNLGLTFHNLWPTPWVTIRYALSVELAGLVLALALYAELGGAPGRRLVVGLAAAFTLLILGRYADVTAPALYGRQINLFWDARHIPAVLAMVVEVAPPWLVVLGGLVALLTLAGLFLLTYQALRRVANALIAAAPRRTLAVTAVALALAYGAGKASPRLDTERWFARPVVPTYVQQARFVLDALTRGGAAATLPATPEVPSDLGRLAGADVLLIFLESYGAVAFDEPALNDALAPARAELERAVLESGRGVVSAFVASPTFGGASWLAHVSLMAGVPISEGRDYELVLTTERRTLVHRLTEHGYRAVALMPGLRSTWPEGAFYGLDRIYGAPDLDYRGPAFGWWRIPDQYALARLDRLELGVPRRAPLFVFFPTITSHMPFRPTPPYQPDWQRLLSDRPFDEVAVRATLQRGADLTDLRPAYADALAYAYTWQAGYLRKRAPADLVMIVVGDHQPPAGVSGARAPWDVPVHVIASQVPVLEALRAAGFAAGLTPRRPILGPLHALMPLLLQAFDSGRTEPSLPPSGRVEARIDVP